MYKTMSDDDQSSTLPDKLSNSSRISLQMTFIEDDDEDDDNDSALGRRSLDTNGRIDGSTFNDSEQFEDFGGSNGWQESLFSRSTPKTTHGRGRSKLPSTILNQLLKSSSDDPNQRSRYSEEIFGDIDGSFNQLNEKVQSLETQVVILTDRLTENDERHVRMKEENCFLVERVHALEEQLRDVEMKSQQLLSEEHRTRRQMMERTDKEKNVEIELLTQSIQHMDSELQLLKEEVPRLRAENDRLRKESTWVRESLTERDERLSELSSQRDELADGCEEERDGMQRERLIHEELLEELTEELDELRLYRSRTEQRMASSTELPRSMRQEYDARLAAFKQEIVQLREQKEELLQAQLVGSDLREGRSLVTGTSHCLADEIENLSKDQLMTALRDYREANSKLREYLDRITLRIIEKHPALLEISK